jgi:hypothetical protein
VLPYEHRPLNGRHCAIHGGDDGGASLLFASASRCSQHRTRWRRSVRHCHRWHRHSRHDHRREGSPGGNPRRGPARVKRERRTQRTCDRPTRFGACGPIERTIHPTQCTARRMRLYVAQSPDCFNHIDGVRLLRPEGAQGTPLAAAAFDPVEHRASLFARKHHGRRSRAESAPTAHSESPSNLLIGNGSNFADFSE